VLARRLLQPNILFPRRAGGPVCRARTNRRTTGVRSGGQMDRWLTHQQGDELFGMSAEAFRQSARREGWRTQPGNEGRTLVLVPDGTAVRPRVRPPGQPVAQTPEQSPGQTPVQPPIPSVNLVLLLPRLNLLLPSRHSAQRVCLRTPAFAEQRTPRC
jgi:hypothetical protein